MFRSFLIIFSVFSILFNQSIAQPISNIKKTENILKQLDNFEKSNFFETRKIYEQHWENLNTQKLGGWKQYKRWEYFWENRIKQDGSFPNAYEILKDYNRYKSELKQITPEIQSKQWEILGPHQLPEILSNARVQGIGRINVVRFDPQNSNVIWVGAATGGVWKSTNLGKTWQTFPFTNFLSLGVSDIAIYKKNSSFIMVATGDDDGTYGTGGSFYSVGIIKTYNGGITWETTSFANQLEENVIISRILINPENYNYILVATNKGIYKSSDGGKNWYKTMDNLFVKDMEFIVNDPNIVIATSFSYSGNAAFYRSKDAGETWEKVFDLDGASRIAIATSEANPNKVWAVASRSGYTSFHSFLVSTDKGETWEAYQHYTFSANFLGRYNGTGDDALVGQGNYDLAIALNPKNENEIFIGGINVWKSTNGGQTFARATNWTDYGSLPFVHADIHDLQFKNNSTQLYVTSDGGISITTDLGKTWTDLSDGISITQYYRIGISTINSELVIGGTQDNGTNMYKNGVFYHLQGGDGMECAILPNNNDVMFMTYYYGAMYKSVNGGKSWSSAVSAEEMGQAGAWVTPFVIDPQNPNIMYIGFQDIFKSTNYGNKGTWNKVSNIKGQTFHTMAISESNSNYVYAATLYKLYRTTNGGVTWENIYNSTIPITYITIHPENPNRFWLTFGSFSKNNKVLEFNNGEEINLSGNLPNVPVNCIVYQKDSPDRLYIGTDIGVFVSAYSSAYWEPYGTGMPNIIINELEINYNDKKIVAGSYGRGIWRTDILECNIPQPEVFVEGDTEFCEGDSVKLIAQDGYSKYEWSTGDTAQFIYAKETGAYSVRVFDNNDCYANSKAVYVKVNETPPILIVNGEKTGFCMGDSVKLSASLGFSTYEWSTGDQGRTLTVSEEGDYWVEGTAKNGCKRRSAITKVVEYPLPNKPSIMQIGNILTYKVEDVIVKDVIWYKDGKQIAKGDSLIITENGDYIVTIIDENGCFATSETESIIVSSINENYSQNDIIVYPNPSSNRFNIVLPANIQGKIYYKIYNQIGELIQSGSSNIISDNNLITFDLDNASSGIYYLKIYTNNQIRFIKLLKK